MLAMRAADDESTDPERDGKSWTQARLEEKENRRFRRRRAWIFVAVGVLPALVIVDGLLELAWSGWWRRRADLQFVATVVFWFALFFRAMRH